MSISYAVNRREHTLDDLNSNEHYLANKSSLEGRSADITPGLRGDIKKPFVYVDKDMAGS